MIVMLLCIFIK